MKKYEYNGKTKEEAIEQALKDLNLSENNIIVNVLEEKNTLLKKNVKIEVIDYIEDKNLGFCLGNVIKYVSRAGKKVDSDKSVIEKEIEDLKKARWYLDRRIYELEREQPNA